MYTIAIYGTNDFIKSDANSLVNLSALTTTDPMTDTNWLKIKIAAIDPNPVSLGDIEEGNGGVAIHSRAYYRQLAIETDYYTFPDDMAEFEAIAVALAKRRVFLFKGDYPEATGWELHPDGKALQVALTMEPSNEHEYGVKSYMLTGREFRAKR